MKRIIAIDIGFVASGVVVLVLLDGKWKVVMSTCITTKPNPNKKTLRVADDDCQRMIYASRQITNIIEKYGCNLIVVEVPHGGAQGARPIRCMALASGMIAAIIGIKGIPVEWYSPNDTRIAATGKRKASKKQVVDAMKPRFPGVINQSTQPAREAVADALATFKACDDAGQIIRILERD